MDLDPQASLTFSFIPPEEWRSNFEASRTIKAWFDSFEETPLALGTLIHAPGRVTRYLGQRGTLHLIPSHLGLINVDLELATDLGGGSMKQARKKYLRVHRRLLDGIRTGVEPTAYDILLIDCPPNFNIVTKTAIVASNYLLTPAKPDYLSTLGIDYLMRNLDELVSNYNEYVKLEDSEKDDTIEPTMLGVVFTMIQEYARQPIAAQRPYIRQTEELGIPVFEAYVKTNHTLFAPAPEEGIPVALVQHPNASHQSVVRSLEALATEFLAKLGE